MAFVCIGQPNACLREMYFPGSVIVVDPERLLLAGSPHAARLLPAAIQHYHSVQTGRVKVQLAQGLSKGVPRFREAVHVLVACVSSRREPSPKWLMVGLVGLMACADAMDMCRCNPTDALLPAAAYAAVVNATRAAGLALHPHELELLPIVCPAAARALGMATSHYGFLPRVQRAFVGLALQCDTARAATATLLRVARHLVFAMSLGVLPWVLPPGAPVNFDYSALFSKVYIATAHAVAAFVHHQGLALPPWTPAAFWSSAHGLHLQQVTVQTLSAEARTTRAPPTAPAVPNNPFTAKQVQQMQQRPALICELLRLHGPSGTYRQGAAAIAEVLRQLPAQVAGDALAPCIPWAVFALYDTAPDMRWVVHAADKPLFDALASHPPLECVGSTKGGAVLGLSATADVVVQVKEALRAWVQAAATSGGSTAVKKAAQHCRRVLWGLPAAVLEIAAEDDTAGPRFLQTVLRNDVMSMVQLLVVAAAQRWRYPSWFCDVLLACAEEALQGVLVSDIAVSMGATRAWCMLALHLQRGDWRGREAARDRVVGAVLRVVRGCAFLLDAILVLAREQPGSPLLCALSDPDAEWRGAALAAAAAKVPLLALGLRAAQRCSLHTALDWCLATRLDGFSRDDKADVAFVHFFVKLTSCLLARPGYTLSTRGHVLVWKLALVSIPRYWTVSLMAVAKRVALLSLGSGMRAACHRHFPARTRGDDVLPFAVDSPSLSDTLLPATCHAIAVSMAAQPRHPGGVKERVTRRSKRTLLPGDAGGRWVPYNTDNPAVEFTAEDGSLRPRKRLVAMHGEGFGRVVPSALIDVDALPQSPYDDTMTQQLLHWAPFRDCTRAMVRQTGPTCFVAAAVNCFFGCALARELMCHMMVVAQRDMPALFELLTGPMSVRPPASASLSMPADSRPPFVLLFLQLFARQLCRDALAFVPITEHLMCAGGREDSFGVGGAACKVVDTVFAHLGFHVLAAREEDLPTLQTNDPCVDCVRIMTDIVSTALAPPVARVGAAGQYLVLFSVLTFVLPNDQGIHVVACAQCPTNGERVMFDSNYAVPFPIDWMVMDTQAMAPYLPPMLTHASHLWRNTWYILADVAGAIQDARGGPCVAARALAAALSAPPADF